MEDNPFVKEKMDMLKKELYKASQPIEVPLLKEGQFFTVTSSSEGVYVSNLHSSPFLPWSVFEETIILLLTENGIVTKGDAMKSRLGDANLPMNSIEGHIAHKVYGKEKGDSVFRRISPIVGILRWADICMSDGRNLLLK